MHAHCIARGSEGIRSPQLELQMVVSRFADAGNQTQVLSRSNSALNCWWSHLSSPHSQVFSMDSHLEDRGGLAPEVPL